MRPAAILFLALLGSPAAIPVMAQSLDVTSPSHRVTLVELFTSEGCSSCPPAEAWMNRLLDDGRLWREVIPVAFHVDYWDYIGWPDRFAVPENSRRQRDYHREGRLSSVYTPGLVADGEEWRGWFRRPVLETDSTRPAGVLSLKVDAQELQARYRPMQDEASASLFLNVAVLGFGLTTRVRDGENAGRTLDHEFVVLGFRRLPMTSTQGMHHAGGGLPAPRTEAPRYGVAAWVSRQGSQAPLQVVGGLLAP